MNSQALNRKINTIKSQIPVSVEPEEEEALRYILGYLDTLVHRKQTGDPAVQVEIEAVCKMMRNQWLIQKANARH